MAGRSTNNDSAAEASKVAAPKAAAPKSAASEVAAPTEPQVSTPAPRRRFDRRKAAVLLGILVILVVVAAGLYRYFAPPASGQTIWQKITSATRADGTLPAQAALEAFAYDFHVSIPGVTIPSGVEGGDAPTDGTGPMRWVQANWDSLTAAQQAVIKPFMGQAAPGSRHYSPGDPVAAAGGVQVMSAKKLAPAGPTPGPADFLNWPIDVTQAPDAPTDLTKAMVQEILIDIAHIGNRLGLPVIDAGYPGSVNIALVVSDADGGDAAMVTIPWNDGGHYEPCQITVYKHSWDGQQVDSNGGVSPLLHVWLTHEVVHCYQNAVEGDLATHNAIPAWISEGSAFYLAAADTNIAEPHMPATWKDYFSAETALTTRNYDAYGWLELVAQHGRDMWSLLPQAWAAAAKGPERSNAYIKVLQGDSPDIVNNWAESYLRRDDWGDPWTMHGFGLPDGLQVEQHDVQAQPDPGWTGSLDSLANTILNVASSGGEVVTVTTNGLASAHDNSGHSQVAFQTQRFCTVSTCYCPNGTLLAGQDVAPQFMQIPFVLAMSSHSGGSNYSIVSNTLDELCKRPATPRPQPSANYGPCGPNCSSTNGDPHMLTVNGFKYDFQAAGEFTLLRSSDGSVDIQARQEPFEDSKAVAINTAIAAKVGGHKVGVYATPSGLQVHVDGAVTDVSSAPVDLTGGGRISAIDNGFEIDLPDGTQIFALSRANYGIFAQIKPSALLTVGQGLLGPIVRGGLGVPALPDGSLLPAATDAHSRFGVVYGQFADAWRVTDATSLFDYDSGKTTASYVIKPFPIEGQPATRGDLTPDQQAKGDSACASITDPGLRDDCAFDVGVTGQTGFADGYTTVQGLYDSGIVAAPGSPSPTVTITPAPGIVAGAWNVIAGSSVSGLAFGENDTVYADIQTGDNVFSLMALDPVNQKILAQVTVPAGTDVHYAAGSVWLPGLEKDANGNVCSVTRFDGQTLAKQATIPVPCGYFGEPEMVSDGSSMWYVDNSKYDAGTNLGAVFVQLDPTTNTAGSTSVPMPFINGYRRDSQGAFFYFGTDKTQGVYRLATGATTLDHIDVPASNSVQTAGTGIWVDSNNGKTASYYTSSSTAQASFSIDGSLVAGDSNAAYVETSAVDAGGNFVNQLWSYPIDGSSPTQIATAPTIDGQTLDYFGDPMPIPNGDGVLKYWLVRDPNNQWQVLLSWIPAK